MKKLLIITLSIIVLILIIIVPNIIKEFELNPPPKIKYGEFPLMTVIITS